MRIYLLFITILFFQCKGKPPTAQNDIAEPESETPVLVKDTVEGTLAEKPAIVTPDFDTTEWEEMIRIAPSIKLDLRYATENNFVKDKMYECGRCFLRPDVAKAVAKAHRFLQEKGFGLKMYDCYRPRPIQWKLWNKVPDPRYVADPRKGSMHNRGMAVDLTIVDSLGNELNMGTDFDYFGKEAYHSYGDHPNEVTDNRVLLLETMEKHGFRPTSTEWWHYSYKSKTYQLDDWLWPCK